jgi:hypothetical protein
MQQADCKTNAIDIPNASLRRGLPVGHAGVTDRLRRGHQYCAFCRDAPVGRLLAAAMFQKAFRNAETMQRRPNGASLHKLSLATQ